MDKDRLLTALSALSDLSDRDLRTDLVTKEDIRQKLIVTLDHVLEDTSSVRFTDCRNIRAVLNDVDAFDQIIDREAVSVLGDSIRQSLSGLLSDSTRKLFGQYFTPAPLSALAAAATVRTQDVSIIDPMCGIGTMLWAAQRQLAHLGGAYNSAEIVGMEIDSLLSRIAALPSYETEENRLASMHIKSADSFLAVAGFLDCACPQRHIARYDAIVGNPPYVRYQDLGKLVQTTSPAVVEAFRETLPETTESKLASMIIRSALVAHLVEPRPGTTVELVRKSIELIQSGTSPQLSPLDALWIKLVQSYSGLADLSLPSWLLTWLLAKPGAKIAFVTTATWRNREYARLLRYFMLRLLEPIFILEQEGNSWFPNALVPTSLMVFKVRSRSDALQPLRLRQDDEKLVKVVRINKDLEISQAHDLHHLAAQLGTTQSIKPTDLPGSANAVVEAIESIATDVSADSYSVSTIPVSSLATELLQDDAAANRAGASGISIREFEDHDRSKSSLRSKERRNNSHQLGLPRRMKQLFQEDSLQRVTSDLVLLSDYGIQVNQGLRTGCNPFFYVKQRPLSVLEERSSTLQSLDVRRVLQTPVEHPVKFRELFHELKAKGVLAINDAPERYGPSCLVQLSSEFESRLAVFPLRYLRPAVRYQRSITAWSVLAPEDLSDLAVVTGNAAHPDDYDSLSRFPEHWIQTWEERDGLELLPSSLSEYIHIAATTQLKRGGKRIRIPKMSAVETNVSAPDVPPSSSLFKSEELVPPPPSWWYTLPLHSRHYGSVFMPRVNSGPIRAYLNSPQPTLIDANFTTLSPTTGPLPTTALFALLNSIWVKAALEEMATIMGGGALKVEAAHVRVLPLPLLSAESVDRLARIGDDLADRAIGEDVTDLTWLVDRAIISDFLSASASTSDEVISRLNQFTVELAERRNT